MGSNEKIEAPEDFEHSCPPPPPRGTEAYRRLVLTIAATDDHREFHKRIEGPWYHVGWRLGVDLMIEVLDQLIRSYSLPLSGSYRDAYGRIPLARHMHTFDDEADRIRYAVQHRERLTPGLPPHESFRRALEFGNDIWDRIGELIPVAQAAVNAMEDTGTREAAWPVLMKYLATKDDRNEAAERATSIIHASLRDAAMRSGTGWIDEFLRRERGVPKEVAGSAAFYAQMDPKQERDAMPDWWYENGERPTTGKPRKKEKKRKPKCTCGRH